MPSHNVQVTDAELAVLQVLWTQGQATIRQITSSLYGEGTTSEYATVQKLLERLERKECVRRDRSGFAHTFAASVSRTDLIDSRLQEVADKLTEGSWTPLLMHLVEAGRFSDADRERLRRIIDTEPETKRQQGEPR
jgi:predicted transcriptional regulator